MDTLKKLPDTAAKLQVPQPVIGDTRRVGKYGPIYKVVKILNSDLLEILMIESGEVAEYDIATYRNDPRC